MELVTSFLKTQVSTPTEEDWFKLKRDIALFYKQTRSDERVIWHDKLQPLYTWVDTAYFAAHLNMHSQTGIAMSMGWGTIHIRTSNKQKLNTKSLTESEVVLGLVIIFHTISGG